MLNRWFIWLLPVSFCSVFVQTAVSVDGRASTNVDSCRTRSVAGAFVFPQTSSSHANVNNHHSCSYYESASCRLLSHRRTRYVFAFAEQPQKAPHRKRVVALARNDDDDDDEYEANRRGSEGKNSNRESTTTTATTTATTTTTTRANKKVKKNKYAAFSKTNDRTMDPLEELMAVSRQKNREIQEERSRNKPGGSVDPQRLASLSLSSSSSSSSEEDSSSSGPMPMEYPPLTEIDPYDPTTYGYVELGIIRGAHGVHGELRVRPTSDFCEERLCPLPGPAEPNERVLRYLKMPQRRSPRKVWVLPNMKRQRRRGGGGNSHSHTKNSHHNDNDNDNDNQHNQRDVVTKNMVLVKIEGVRDRDAASRLAGGILYSLESEGRSSSLEPDEYVVTELIGVNVFVVTEEEDKDSMMELPIPIGTVAGVVLGSDISSVQGLGQDLLEVALLRNHGNGEQPQPQQQQLVLIPFVPQIVPFVDVKSNRIVIDPPAGLLDLTYVREEKRTIKGLLPPAKSSL